MKRDAMKRILVGTLVTLVNVSANANPVADLASTLSDWLPTPANQARKARDDVLQAAGDKVEAGMSWSDACYEAKAEAKLTTEAWQFLRSDCDRYAEHVARGVRDRKLEEAKRKQEADAKAARELAQIVSEIKAGRRPISSFEEAVAVYGAANGQGLPIAPKVRADGMVYYVMAFVEKPAPNGPEFIAKSAGLFAMPLEQTPPDYVHVRVPPKLRSEYFEHARVGLPFRVVGRYTANTEYRTVGGARKTMPVLDAMYLEF